MTTPAPKRKAIPDRVKVAVLLRQLGLTGAVEWSHEPALALRAINAAGTDYEPGQHDPRFICARSVQAHAVLTNENNGTGRSDKTAIAHVRHLASKSLAHVQAMQAKANRVAEEPARRSRWTPGRKMQSRGFR